jgi:hypothetical protein
MRLLTFIKFITKILMISTLFLTTLTFSEDLTTLIPDFKKNGIWTQFQYGLDLSDSQSREIMTKYKAYDRTRRQLEKSRIYVESNLLKQYALDFPEKNLIDGYTKALYRVKQQLSTVDLDFFFDLKGSLTKDQFDNYLSYNFSRVEEPIIAYTKGHKTNIRY